MRYSSLLVLALGVACRSVGAKQSPEHEVANQTSSSQAALSATPRMSASPHTDSESHEGELQAQTPKPGSQGHFGGPFLGAPSQTLEQLLAKPDEFANKPVSVSGIVKRVCQRRGCWMEISSKPEAKASCRVRFKDYGFFVPTDSTGAKVTAEGILEVNRVTKSRVEHLEKEGAVFDSKNPDGSANETQFIASGVDIQR
ncbi:MAG TPA: DUF4920 domain-containing protein [Polyangiaceae bacterium]|jgi:hypothetical protein|nr:DUF4920 domain-containing protein [Polyangiaceae bacterium]